MFAAVDESHMIARNSSKVRIWKSFDPTDPGKAVAAARKAKEGKAREVKTESQDENRSTGKK